MKYFALLAAMALSTAGCGPEDTEAKADAIRSQSGRSLAVFDIVAFRPTPYMAYVDPVDQQIAWTGMPVEGRSEPCSRAVTVGGETTQTTIPTDECVFMEEPKLWRGRWLNQYEDSAFCSFSGSRTECDAANFDVWLSIDRAAGKLGRTYSIAFIGRKTRYDGGYGHMGGYRSEIIVDRVLALQEE